MKLVKIEKKHDLCINCFYYWESWCNKRKIRLTENVKDCEYFRQLAYYRIVSDGAEDMEVIPWIECKIVKSRCEICEKDKMLLSITPDDPCYYVEICADCLEKLLTLLKTCEGECDES